MVVIPDFHAAQEQIAAACAGELVKKDDLIALHRTTVGDGTAFQGAIIGIVLDAGDEVDAVGIEPGTIVVFHRGFPDYAWFSSLEAQGAGRLTLMHAAFGHQGIAGQQPLGLPDAPERSTLASANEHRP